MLRKMSRRRGYVPRTRRWLRLTATLSDAAARPSRRIGSGLTGRRNLAPRPTRTQSRLCRRPKPKSRQRASEPFANIAISYLPFCGRVAQSEQRGEDGFLGVVMKRVSHSVEFKADDGACTNQADRTRTRDAVAYRGKSVRRLLPFTHFLYCLHDIFVIYESRLGQKVIVL